MKQNNCNYKGPKIVGVYMFDTQGNMIGDGSSYYDLNWIQRFLYDNWQWYRMRNRLLRPLVMEKKCGCNGDCACAENFAHSEKLKKHFEENASMFDNFLCVETDKGNPKCKIQCPFCERV